MNRKHVFWQALLSAALIFGIGLLLGVVLEDSRSRGVETILLGSEINVLDSQLLGQVSNMFNVSCDVSTESLIEFTDSIYEEAKLLEEYDASSQLTGTLEILHRRYDLLRVLVWMQAIDLKENCGRDFHTVVYIFQYKDPGVGTRSTQSVFSKFLEELKAKYGSDLILIPIAGDLELGSVELIKKQYNIEDYPAVILNEDKVVRDLIELKDIEGLMIGSI